MLLFMRRPKAAVLMLAITLLVAGGSAVEEAPVLQELAADLQIVGRRVEFIL